MAKTLTNASTTTSIALTAPNSLDANGSNQSGNENLFVEVKLCLIREKRNPKLAS